MVQVLSSGTSKKSRGVNQKGDWMDGQILRQPQMMGMHKAKEKLWHYIDVVYVFMFIKALE